jgi:hypothetical protein
VRKGTATGAEKSCTVQDLAGTTRHTLHASRLSLWALAVSSRSASSSFGLQIGLAAALLALCLRLLAPVGWMPMATSNGIVMTLCSGAGNHQTVVADVGKPSKPDTADKHSAPCAFSGLGTPALADLPPALALPLLLLFIAVGRALQSAPPVTGALRLWPPLRGPPLGA